MFELNHFCLFFVPSKSNLHISIGHHTVNFQFPTQIRYDTIRYDTIRYDIDLRALESWRDGQLNLAHGPETKNNEKIKIKNRVAQKKRCRQKSVEAVREEEVKLRGVGFVKEVGFKPGVKERWSYRCRLQSGESEEEVMGEGIGEQEIDR